MMTSREAVVFCTLQSAVKEALCRNSVHCTLSVQVEKINDLFVSPINNGERLASIAAVFCLLPESAHLVAGKPFFFIMCRAGIIHLLHCCRHLHQLLDMPTHTPNMVNMMMQTQAVSGSSPSQDVPAALTSQLGAETDLAQHTQQLGEPQHVSRYYKCVSCALKRATQDCTHSTLSGLNELMK